MELGASALCKGNSQGYMSCKKPLTRRHPSCKNQLPSAPEIIMVVIKITIIENITNIRCRRTSNTIRHVTYILYRLELFKKCH